MVTSAERADAEANRRISAELFREGLTPASSGLEWRNAVAQAKLQITAALKASSDLTDMVSAVMESGRHIEVFRYLLAPPMSQDRLKILCPAYPKGAEKSGGAVGRVPAEAVVKKLEEWRDGDRMKALRPGSPDIDRRIALEVTAALMAHRAVATVSRTASSSKQEDNVTEALKSIGWAAEARKPLQSPGDLPPRRFMHKARMANAGGLEQAVDVACGLDSKGRVLALECKVSNDVTNSIKRANDVLNKARAWQTHWGNFVVTAAMLQGVFATNDVKKLLDAGVKVFWYHQLPEFLIWVDAGGTD